MEIIKVLENENVSKLGLDGCHFWILVEVDKDEERWPYKIFTPDYKYEMKVAVVSSFYKSKKYRYVEMSCWLMTNSPSIEYVPREELEFFKKVRMVY